ncbi:DNA-binding transcriptional MerR regulator [Anaerosolibacter carboniphilus]|uniref:DNA-binding transcriptional MerR regulator n=1 Tax=Anaerosolibacter carboniphilus TaxID=1417629 RepID=A0A841KSE5_9FIRM|nr:MerR family transcriptional regulator [Anaerosolibacter carboniphilus]MBB6216323.1 DNA-binding transcriptional MerR regulator [Anaerosolibacter carboniphilus]
MIKIGEVAVRYNISNRTLRYWEEVGILASIRLDNGYRFYDDENITRINQIMVLRKLRLPIRDIQRIFVSNELSCVVSALCRHLEDTRHEVEELNALSIVLERLIEAVKYHNSISEIFEYLDIPDNTAILELKNALQITLSERNNFMSENSSYNKIGNVRIVKLPRMIFACFRAESTTPENDCSAVVNKLIFENSLHEKYGFRHFGFNNPDPQKDSPVYGYEMWVVVPEDFAVPEPFYRKEFAGGLYASLSTQMTIIGERWRQLSDWVMNSRKYEMDWNPDADRICLEECIDYISFISDDIDENDKQLDLLTPIKLKRK